MSPAMNPCPRPDQARALAHYTALAADAARLAAATPGPWRWDGHNLVPAEPDPRNHAVHTILQRGDSFGFVGAASSMLDAELHADFAIIEAAPLLHSALFHLVNAASVALAGSAVLLNAQAALDAARSQIPVPEVVDSDFGAFEAAGGCA